MHALNDLILGLAGSPLVLVALFALVVIDGFFPPVPSESLVVALASIGLATGAPSPLLVLLVAAIGSVIGDNIAFMIGRKLGLERFRFTRGPKIRRTLDRVPEALRKRPASFIVTARFIPVARVAVNALTGSTSFPHRRFFLISLISGVAWAGYSVAVGVLAGAWLNEQPVLGAIIAVILALAVGMGIDRISRRRQRRQSNAKRLPLGSQTVVGIAQSSAPLCGRSIASMVIEKES